MAGCSPSKICCRARPRTRRVKMRFEGRHMHSLGRMIPAGAIAAFLTTPVSAAAPSQTLSLPGLTQPVEIIKDHWGISHIYAKNESDLFFAQGFNAARDRLFQLERGRR